MIKFDILKKNINLLDDINFNFKYLFKFII